MSGIIATAAVIAICIIAAVILSRALLMEDKGRHGENINVYQARPVAGDDTEQMNSFDRSQIAARYNEATERLAMADEHELFLLDDAVWTAELRVMFAQHAEIQAYLNTGVLAFPDWTDKEYPHNWNNYTCPGPGIKCLCWDIDSLPLNWERIVA